MFEQCAFENAAIQTDFKHTFCKDKVVPPGTLPNANSSPYQTLIKSDDGIAAHGESV